MARAKSPTPLRLLTLGGAELQGVKEGPALHRKDFALFVHLLLERRVHRRSTLAALLWAESPETDARHSLTQALRRLRGQIGEDAVKSGRETVEWVQPVSCDALDLEALAARGDAEPEALAVYAGEFLAGFHPGKGAEEFEKWMESRRGSYRTVAADLLERWSAAAEEDGRAAEALRLAQRLTEVDFYREAAHRRIMRMLGAGGGAGQALRHYEHFAERLDREVGIAPQEPTRVLAQQLRAGERSAEPQRAAQVPRTPRRMPEEDASPAARALSASPPGIRAAVRPWARPGVRLPQALLVAAAAIAFLVLPLRKRINGVAVPDPLGAAGCAPGEAVARFAGETFPDNVPVAPGERFTKQWTLRNTGRCVWSQDFSLHFESANAPLALVRRRVPIPREVAPGDTVILTLPMRAPTRPGVYREHWSLRDAERAIVPVSSSNTVWTRIIVAPPGAPPCTADNAVAKFVDESHPDHVVLPAGHPFAKRWTLRNGGHCTWLADFALQYATSSDGRLGTSTRARLGRPLAPGGTHDFVVPMRVPAQAGTYREDWSFYDSRGDTIRVSGSQTIWAIVVAAEGR